ncbi:hypothetical protein C162_17102 [Paenibacillus sp. FSL R7-269]|nr:hypothetical protein C162_17102 [Paenibacillus sp. FSL R7-269]
MKMIIVINYGLIIIPQLIAVNKNVIIIISMQERTKKPSDRRKTQIISVFLHKMQLCTHNNGPKS